MAETVSKSAFKPKALEYFRRVQQSGRALIITEHGKPVLQIVPYADRVDETLASLRGSVVAYDAPEEPVGGDQWEALQ